ncbi:hypothetical protein GCM10018781_23770 [Kitasatospora indigofera]|uniref:Uncharacterized protein n=1 Tax=Kitasatospora indigofera TaxID=67307 RepID=A0A919FL52_9ACTN|nr:hypothetical protein GCM10018781_23770 [Kitasatospora indigofera]
MSATLPHIAPGQRRGRGPVTARLAAPCGARAGRVAGTAPNGRIPALRGDRIPALRGDRIPALRRDRGPVVRGPDGWPGRPVGPPDRLSGLNV